MEEPNATTPESPKDRKRFNQWLIIALAAAVAAGILLASSVWRGSSGPGEDSLVNRSDGASEADLQSWCAAQATYDLIRRELFRRAANVRGSDQQTYARLADFAVLRVSEPVARGVDEQLRSVTCTGSATLDLPPGVSVAGGRRSLAGDIEYSIQPAADGTGNVVRLGNADAIVVPLATLGRRGLPQTPAVEQPDQQSDVVEDPPGDVSEQSPPADDPPVSRPATANPSFDCGRARTRGETAVCNDPGLAALDRQMAGQFNAALSQADLRQRALLQRTRGRFLSFRDRCGSNQCIAEAYRGRMREIDDIMANRWRG